MICISHVAGGDLYDLYVILSGEICMIDVIMLPGLDLYDLHAFSCVLMG